MQLIVQIPDEMAQRLSSTPGDLSRRALEALAADEYRHGRLNKPDLRQLLGLQSGDQIDGFLKSHGVYEEYSMEELNLELEALRRAGV